MSQQKGTILVTGANGGLGSAIVSQLVSNPKFGGHHGIFTVRSAEAAAALDSIHGYPVPSTGLESHEVILLDLSSLSSVREVSATVNARVASGAIPTISALILSAGYEEAGKQTWNEDGLDTSFVVNYLSQWLLTLQLLQSMDRRTGRVVWISSWSQDPQDRHNVMNGSFDDARFKTIIADNLEPLATGTWSADKDDKTSWAAGYRRYGASKLCAVAMIHELQRRLDQDPVLSGISVLAVDPGAMATGIVRQSSWFVRVVVFRIFARLLGGLLVRLYPNGTWRTPQKSAHDVLAATMDDGPLPLTERPKGLYLNGSELGDYNPEARDPDKGRVIWEGSLRVPLISSVQKHYHNISWVPLMGHAISWISGTNEATNSMMARDVVTDKGFLLGMKKAAFAALAPGASLDAMNMLAIQEFAKNIDVLAGKGQHQLSLFPWIRSQILMATTEAIYGPHNPFRDQSVAEAWDVYKPGIPNLGPKALPTVFSTKSLKAREYINHNIKDLSELSRLELAGAFASIENTVPTTFWFLYRIFSDPVVLRDCRRELAPLVQQRDGVCYVDVDSIKASCPILQSTLHETMRYHSVSISARKVIEDHVLGKYLLKGGSTLLIPASVPHFDHGTWGADVHRFDHTRFVQQAVQLAKRGAKRTAFRGFGGGFHLCPGRHFAAVEMLSLASMMLLRFDVTPIGERWAALEKAEGSFNGTAALVPNSDVPVIISPRSRENWAFFVSGTGKQIELLAE
ncbi:hypothetical protein GQX73_g6605 [Xylaria multiplex]|uniref:Uncharacterized protein n=1 Tax=Xylaria multiplex TaxID=323545 RepID=A0A7C8MP08_9PEZI|nr:hypothetical protein GQX73_g6605 [Xylaria multiplex]